VSGDPNKLRAIKAVYSYYLPEVREVISRLVVDYPHDVFMKSVDPGLDDFHVPIAEQFVAYWRADVPALSHFPHRYPTAGSEEFIREFISSLEDESIYVWEGEYEGYKEVGKTRGIQTVEVPFDTDPKTLSPGIFFISNPSARDGNILNDDAIHAVAEAGHRIFYDLAYLGSTSSHTFDVSHNNIVAVATSFSKTFGLFYYRQGFGFTRTPVDALWANKWFKSVFALLVAQKVMDEIPPGLIREKYLPVQREILATMRSETGLPLSASDAFLIASIENPEGLNAAQAKAVAKFRRGPHVRLCLTPYFQEWEKRG
jgi:histidinol-phosphate/aromatic aminotransferase/cobyric acid decarboxylase-like protein